MIRYTQRTRNILNFVDRYGFITAKICGHLFFKNNKSNIEQARHKLRTLADNKDLIASKKGFGKELIYQRKKEVVSDHKYYLLNLYAQINQIADKVDYFKMEEKWNFTNKKSDAHIIFSYSKDGYSYKKAFLVEFDKYHKTEKDKYDKIFNSNEVQSWYQINYEQQIFPDIVIINYSGETDITTDYDYKIIGLNYEFNDLFKKLIL